MLARAAAADLGGPAREAGHVVGVRTSSRDARTRVAQGAQAEEARTALRRALAGEVGQDARRLAHAARVVGDDTDDAAAQAVAALLESGVF